MIITHKTINWQEFKTSFAVNIVNVHYIFEKECEKRKKEKKKSLIPPPIMSRSNVFTNQGKMLLSIYGGLLNCLIFFVCFKHNAPHPEWPQSW